MKIFNSVLTVTMNASIDKAFRVARFVPGGVFHISDPETAPGGKGINAARNILQLAPELKVSATGFIGGFNGKYILSLLHTLGVEAEFVEVEAESRLCITLIDNATASDTKLNEEGSYVAEQDCEKFLDKMDELARRFDCVAICGRTPPGAPKDFYAQMIRIIHRYGKYVALDTSGEALKSGISAKPDLVKVNLDEFRDLCGQSCRNMSELIFAAESDLFGNIELVVTLGSNGAVSFGNPNLHAKAPRIDYVSAVGSGDAFLAGLLVAKSHQLPRDEALKYAVATGANAAEFASAGLVDRRRVEQLKAGLYCEALECNANNPTLQES